MFIVNNLAVIFCAGIAGAMAKKDKGHATLIGLMSFFLFLNANNITLEALGMLAEPTQLGLVGTGQSEVLGIQVLDMGVFGGIILGCIAGWVFNKFGSKQFPIALSMFSGVRFPFLIIDLHFPASRCGRLLRSASRAGRYRLARRHDPGEWQHRPVLVRHA